MLEMGKEEKNKPRANRKEEVLRSEINKIQKRITEENNKTFFEKIDQRTCIESRNRPPNIW